MYHILFYLFFFHASVNVVGGVVGAVVLVGGSVGVDFR